MYPYRRGHCLSKKINNRQLAYYLLYAHPGILRALSLSHCDTYLAQRNCNARIIKLNIIEGTNESFLARKLSKLYVSNSSGPCACIHLLLVSIVMSFTLRHVYTRKRNKQTLRSRSSLSFKMHSQSWILILSNRRKRFRIPGRRLFLAPDQ